jgi:zinc transport system ATP-binding protein
MKKNLLRLNDVSFAPAGNIILQNISLDIHSDCILTIIGPNGAGKSTLLKLILGLLQPTSGFITREKKLRIGYMPQKLMLNSTFPLTVERFLKSHPNTAIESVDQALENVGALELKKKSMHVLSGGEFQRVLLAYALINRPELLVLDEPVQGVDVDGQQKVYDLIATIRKKWKCSVVIVSHDLHYVMAESNHVVCINKHICCAGEPKVIIKDPEYTKLYGAIVPYEHTHDHTHDILSKG